MSTPSNTSEILHKAADLIEEHGWTSGSGWPGADTFDGRLCLEGGIMAALGVDYSAYYDFKGCPAYRAVAQYLTNPEVNPADLQPFMWNDQLTCDPGRGWVGGSEAAARAYAKARVIEVLRAAAVVEASREVEPAEVTA